MLGCHMAAGACLCGMNPPPLPQDSRLYMPLPRRLLPVVLPTLFGVYALEFGAISLLPLITNRLNVSVSVGSVFMAMFTLLIAVSGPILTLFSSQINRGRFLTGALFIVAAGNVFSACATDILSLMAARLVPALIHPMLFPAVFALAISLYPRRKKTFVIFLGVAGAAAGLALSVPLTAFLGTHFSFSSTYLMFAAFDAAIGLLLILSAPPKPTDRSLRAKFGNRRAAFAVCRVMTRVTNGQDRPFEKVACQLPLRRRQRNSFSHIYHAVGESHNH